MKKIKVAFEVQVPEIKHTDEELEEWIRFELGDNGQCSMKNPLVKEGVEPIFGTFEWNDA